MSILLGNYESILDIAIVTVARPIIMINMKQRRMREFEKKLQKNILSMRKEQGGGLALPMKRWRGSKMTKHTLSYLVLVMG